MKPLIPNERRVSSVFQRLLNERPLPILWIIAAAYLLISPMAILIPADVFTIYPWSRNFTESIAAWIPMIDRVVAYGHPHPDKLRTFLAYAWCCVPAVTWTSWRYQETQIKYHTWKTTTPFWIRPISALVFFLAFGFYIWYCPNHIWVDKQILGALTISFDERKRIFWSNYSLLLYTPLWIFAVASILEILRSEISNLCSAIKTH